MKVKAFKFVTKFVVASGVRTITNAIIDNNVIPQTKIQRVFIAAGKIGISVAASAIVIKHVDAQIDELIKEYTDLLPQNKVANQTELQPQPGL